MDFLLPMSTTHTHIRHPFMDSLAIGQGLRDFLNCTAPSAWHPACRVGRASVFAALGCLERPNTVNRFACSRREVLFAT